MSSRDAGVGVRGVRPDTSGSAVSVAGRVGVAGIQRARLISAMVEIAGEQGLAGATVAHVVARAGVSRRTFYELFDDREDCFLAGFDEGIAHASRYVLDAYDPRASWVVRLRMALTGLLVFFEVERGMGQLLIVGSLGAGPKALERRAHVLFGVFAFVEEGREGVSSGSQPPSLVAEGVVGGVLSVIHARMVMGLYPLTSGPRTRARADPLVGLLNPLMSMIVLPYLGSAAARKELTRPVPKLPVHIERAGGDPFRDLDMRLTYRTVRVLMSVAENPGSSNRGIGESAGITDQGQISKLLGRLERLGLIRNQGLAPGKGAPNAWTLTTKGTQVEQIIRTDTDR